MKSKEILACTLALTITVCSSIPALAEEGDYVGNDYVIPSHSRSILDKVRWFTGSVRYAVENVRMISMIGKPIVAEAKEGISVIGYKRAVISKNTNEVLKNLDKELECISGQDEAIEAVKEQIKGILQERIAKTSNGESLGTKILYLIGPSGVGKTATAELVAKALLPKGCKPFSISDSAVSKECERSIEAQLFEKQPGGTNRYGSPNIATDLLRRIMTNPNTVLIINEYDKMQTREFDALLRRLIDEGKIKFRGVDINCDGLIIIITSNESTKSASEGALPGEDRQLDDDGSHSRTLVAHEQSILNRLETIEFKNLNKDHLKKIAKDSFERGFLQVCRDEFGIDVKINESTYDKLAERAVELNKGARGVKNDLLKSFRAKVLDITKSDTTVTVREKRRWPVSVFDRCTHRKKQAKESIRTTRHFNASFNGREWSFEEVNKGMNNELDEEASKVADTVDVTELNSIETQKLTSELEEEKESSKAADVTVEIGSEDKEERVSSKRLLRAIVQMIKEEEESREAVDEAVETDSEDKEERVSGKRPLRAIVQMIEEEKESREAADEAVETDSENKEKRASSKHLLRAIVQTIEKEDY